MTTHEHVQHCTLFQGLSADELDYALRYFDSRPQHYKKGEYLHRVSFPLRRFGLLLSGTVQVYMDDIDGHHMIMNNVRPGETFGESYCFLGTDAPIYICAVTDASVLWMSTDRLKDAAPSARPLERTLTNRFIAMLAARTLSMNRRIQILSKGTLRGKLIAFLSQYAAEAGTSFTVPFDRANMADYLGADRSALSRELSRMQAEGLLEFSKNRFRILP